MKITPPRVISGRRTAPQYVRATWIFSCAGFSRAFCPGGDSGSAVGGLLRPVGVQSSAGGPRETVCVRPESAPVTASAAPREGFRWLSPVCGGEESESKSEESQIGESIWFLLTLWRCSFPKGLRLRAKRFLHFFRVSRIQGADLFRQLLSF